MPLALKRPHLSKSRLETCPCDKALTISCRFWRALAAARIWAGVASFDKYTAISPYGLLRFQPSLCYVRSAIILLFKQNH
jgi:hypothetical protein